MPDFDKVVTANLTSLQHQYISESKQLLANECKKRPVALQWAEKLAALVSPLL